MKAPWFYIRNDAGRPSLSATLVIVSFVFTLFLFTATFVVRAMGHEAESYTGVATSLLVPVLSMYWARKHTDSKVPMSGSGEA